MGDRPSVCAKELTTGPSRHYKPALRLAGCFVGILSATYFVGIEDGAGLVWIANGLLLSYLLLAPRWRWKHYFAVAFFAMLAGGLAAHPQRWQTCLALSALNILEVAIAAFLLRGRSAQMPHFADWRYLLRFSAYAVLTAPVIAGLIFGLVYSRWSGLSPWHVMTVWTTTDSLGYAVVVPTFISLLQSGLKMCSNSKARWIYMASMVAVTVLSFAQVRVPVVLLIYPLVAIGLLRFGFACANISSLFVAAVGGWLTLQGEGPFAKITAITPISPMVLFQLYLACGIFMLYAASAVVDTLRSTEEKLREIVTLHNLVTENSRDVIILADFNGHRSYVSASAAMWGGWGREELLGMNSLSLVHPEDRSMAESLVRDLRSGGNGGLLECRVRHKDGDFVWVEANLRPVRDPTTGEPVGILNMVRDIARRKKAELELKEANAALEALSLTDALTRVANRRRYDQCLLSEWRRGIRENLPLSLLVLDVDWFKSYNDTYGHPSGDGCLKQIAEAAQVVVSRTSDLVARIGGEEFAIILPNTPAAGAIEVAELICSAVRHRKLLHNTNPLGCVTISVGCSTIIPSLGQSQSILMSGADKALYAAKHGGRNRVCSTDLEVQPEASLKAR